MPSVPSGDPPPIKSPICPSCNKPMRFESAVPDKTYPNLRHARFVCECGRSTDQLIADQD